MDATEQPTTSNIDTSLNEFHIRDGPFAFGREEQEGGGVDGHQELEKKNTSQRTTIVQRMELLSLYSAVSP